MLVHIKTRDRRRSGKPFVPLIIRNELQKALQVRRSYLEVHGVLIMESLMKLGCTFRTPIGQPIPYRLASILVLLPLIVHAYRCCTALKFLERPTKSSTGRLLNAIRPQDRWLAVEQCTDW